MNWTLGQYKLSGRKHRAKIKWEMQNRSRKIGDKGETALTVGPREEER